MRTIATLTFIVMLSTLAVPVGAYQADEYRDVEEIFHRFKEDVHEKTHDPAPAKKAKDKKEPSKAESEKPSKKKKKKEKDRKPTPVKTIQFQDGKQRMVIATPAPPFDSDEAYWAISDAMLLFHKYAQSSGALTLTDETTRSTKRMLRELSHTKKDKKTMDSKFGSMTLKAVVKDKASSDELHVYRLQNNTNHNYNPDLSRFGTTTIIAPATVAGNSSGLIAMFRSKPPKEDET